jgi:nitrate reductase gamma subunit
MYLNFFLFQLYPYIALTVFIVASWIRYDRDQYSWNARSSQILSDRWFVLGNNLFHWSVVLILCSHFVGLLTPEVLYKSFISPAHKQFMAMVVGGILGVLCFIGLTILVFRRLFNARVRATSRTSDIVILLAVYIQLILGLATIPFSAQHLDGVEMEALANWVQHLAILDSNSYLYLNQVSLIFKIHVLWGMTLFVLFPFTRLVHVISVPLKYMTRTGYQIVRK